MPDSLSQPDLTKANLMAELAHLQAQLDQLQASCTVAKVQCTTELRQVNRALRILSRFNRALVRATDETTLLNRLCATLVSVGGYQQAGVSLRQPQQHRSQLLEVVSASASVNAANNAANWVGAFQKTAQRALRTGRPQILRSPVSDVAPWSVAQLPSGSVIILPLIDLHRPQSDRPQRAFGCLTLYTPELDAFIAAEVDLLQELTGDLIYGLTALRSQPAQQQAEAELSESEARWQLAITGSNDGLWDHNLITNHHFLSPRCVEILGYELHQISTFEQWLSYVHPDDLAWLQTTFAQHLDHQTPRYSCEYRMRCQDGSLKWILSRGQASWGATGQPLRAVGSITDITDRKQAEAALLQSQQQYQTLAEVAPVGIFRADARGHDLYVNQRWCQITQRSFASALAEGWADAVHPEDRDRVLTEWHQAMRSQQLFQSEYRFQRPDGSTVWVFGQAVAATDQAGLVTGYVGTMTDITARKQAETALHQSEAKYRLLFEANPNPMWIMAESTWQLLTVNQAAIEHYGYSAAEFMTLTLGDICAPAAVSHQLEAIPPAGQATRFVGTWQHRKKDGTLITVEVNAHAITWAGQPARCAVLKDVTTQVAAERERQQAEAALQATTAELEALFAAMTDVVLVRDAQGRCLKVAPTNFKNLHQPLAALMGTTVAETMPKAQADIVLGCIQQALLTGQPVYGEYCLPIGDRDTHFLTAFAPMADDAVMLVAHDITHRKQAEEALRQSAEKFRVAFKQSPIAMAMVSLDQRYLQLNQAYSHLFGYPLDELMAITFVELTHPDDLALDLAYTAQLARGEIAYFQIEKRFFHKTGRIIYALLNVALVTDGHGQPLYMIGQIVDITTRKQAEQMLKEANALLEIRVADRTASLMQVNRQLQQELQERQKVEQELRTNQGLLQAIVDHSPAVIYIHDRANRVLLANRQYTELFQLPITAILGHHLPDILPPPMADYCAAATARVLAAGQAIELEVIVEAAAGPRTYLLIKFPLFNAAGQIYALCGIATDITERTVVARLKDEFMAVVSHELRTPLTAIYAGLNLLTDGLLDPQSPPGQRAIQIAVDSTNRLVHLVNDILDLERLESGHLSLVCQIWDLATLMTRATDEIQVIAEQAKITLSVVPLAIDLNVDGDRIIQVLTNLIANAIKFSAPGTTVALTADRSASDPSTVLIQICDQGRGITPDQLENIFERFHQVDLSDARQKGGIGLGLPICRNIVQRHSGEIWAESTVGVGSCFYIQLPMQLRSPN